MSAHQLVFEGPDPERLLLEALSAHGTDVRITEPTAVRHGGVFGFFQKLHYRIEVLPPTGAAAPLRIDAPRAAPEQGAVRVARQPAHAPASAAQVPSGASDAAASAAREVHATAHALDALVEATEDHLEVGADAPVAFDALLERVAGSLGEDPETDAAALASLELPRITVPADARPHPGASTPAPVRREPDATCPAPQALASRLTLAGVPRPLAAEVARRASCLTEAAALFPHARPLPRSAGSLVAVVGPAPRARAAARAIAEELGSPEEAICEAVPRRRRAPGTGHRVAHGAREAADLHAGWRRGRVAVVAVVLPAVRREDLAWCRDVLTALEPSFTLLLADAGAKPEDIAHRCAAFGGADGLMLEGLEETLTPATALAAGPPVARLGERSADPVTWADALAAALDRRGSRE